LRTPSPEFIADLCTDLGEYAVRADYWLEAMTDEHHERPTARQLRERDAALCHFLYQLAEDLSFWREMLEGTPGDYS
jgi:hypothetical protein